MLILTGALIFSLMLAFNLPAFYESARLAAEEACQDISTEYTVSPIRPFLAIVLLCGGAVPAWLLTHDLALTTFIILLGSAAYIDCMTRWVPDVLIFTLSWVALIAVALKGHNVTYSLSGALVMLLPALAMNMAAWLRSQQPALATGDLYILPAVGVWMVPEWAGFCIGFTLVLTLILNRYVREAPFIAVLYPVFAVGAICGA